MTPVSREIAGHLKTIANGKGVGCNQKAGLSLDFWIDQESVEIKFIVTAYK